MPQIYRSERAEDARAIDPLLVDLFRLLEGFVIQVLDARDICII